MEYCCIINVVHRDAQVTSLVGAIVRRSASNIAEPCGENARVGDCEYTRLVFALSN